MATKGSSGSRRWITRRPLDTRPILGLYDERRLPAWLRRLERIAPWGCYVAAAATAAIVAYAYATDLFAGHLGG